MAPSVKRSTGTQAVDRASDLLIQVLKSEKPLSFSYLTSNSGLAKGTASRDRKSTRLNSSHSQQSRMPSSA